MTKLFCDCCGKQIDKIYSFSYYTHIPQLALFGYGSYVDKDMNAVSGRHETEELCIECYNIIMVTAFNKFKSIRNNPDEL